MSDAAQGYPGAVAAMQRGGPAFSAGSGRGGGGGGRGGGGGGRGGGTAPRKAAPNVGGKTLKLKNNFRLHKQSLKLEAVEEGAKQELHFTFDAEIAGEAQIFWDCVDMTFPEVLKDPQQLQKVGLDLQREKASSKPKWFKFPVSRSSFCVFCPCVATKIPEVRHRNVSKKRVYLSDLRSHLRVAIYCGVLIREQAGTSQSWQGAAIRSSKASSKSMQKERTWEHAGKSGTHTCPAAAATAAAVAATAFCFPAALL
jgi:hypothetical protein